MSTPYLEPNLRNHFEYPPDQILEAYDLDGTATLPHHNLLSEAIVFGIANKIFSGSHFDNPLQPGQKEGLEFLRAVTGRSIAEFQPLIDWLVWVGPYRVRKEVMNQMANTWLHNGVNVVISYAPEFLAKAACFDFAYVNYCFGTRYITDSDGVFTGEYVQEDKGVTLRRIATQLGLSIVGAYGDSAPDISMLEASLHPGVLNPDPILAERAKLSGWKIFSPQIC